MHSLALVRVVTCHPPLVDGKPQLYTENTFDILKSVKARVVAGELVRTVF
jgi:hypothetical protein